MTNISSSNRSKFNVDKSVEKRTYDGVVYDSQLEMKYYRDVVKPKLISGEISKCELQKKYELQPKFCKGDKFVQPINYVADFYLEYSNGKREVIDTKGYPDPIAKMKRKMFWYKYPDIDYKWMTHIKKFGGWMTYEEAQSFRKKEKAQKNKEKND